MVELSVMTVMTETIEEILGVGKPIGKNPTITPLVFRLLSQGERICIAHAMRNRSFTYLAELKSPAGGAATLLVAIVRVPSANADPLEHSLDLLWWLMVM